jgi:S1-C subfamily serine protease
MADSVKVQEGLIKKLDEEIAANQNNKNVLADLVAKRKIANQGLAILKQDIAKTSGGPVLAGTGVSVDPISVNPVAKSDEAIGKENAASVILIEAAWKITDTGTGSQIYLYHHRNDLGACPQADKSDYLPMFIEDQGALSPVLSTLSNEGHNTPIVGSHSGTGFLVGRAGFFLTNRHVLAPWRATWNVASFTKKTMGLKVKGNSIVGCITDAEFPSAWVPSEGSKMVVDKMESVMNADGGAAQQQSVFSDRLKYNPLRTSVQGEAMINVTVAKTTQRYRAASVTLSEKHDIALGKVDLPGELQGVTMFPDSDAISQGQHVVVLGYPAVSPDAFGVEVSRDMFTNKAHYSAIAAPTLNSGPISKVISSGNSVRGVDGYISSGEVYQLGINTTGAGNSGGPVFDDKGRVIAVFYAGATLGGASVTYAVPVKFGKELIDNSPVMK